MIHANSSLLQWTPASPPIFSQTTDYRDYTAVATGFAAMSADPTTCDIWGIRVRYPHRAEIFVAGDFNRWSLPGPRLGQWGHNIWETRIALRPGEYRFACYVLGELGFHRIASEHVDCFIESAQTKRRITHGLQIPS